MSEAFPVLSIFLYSYNIHLSVNLLTTWHIPEGKPFLAEWTAGLSEFPKTPGLFEQGWVGVSDTCAAALHSRSTVGADTPEHTAPTGVPPKHTVTVPLRHTGIYLTGLW